MNHLPTLQASIRGRPLLLYLASNSQAIGALLAQEDDQGNEQPIYYVSRTLKGMSSLPSDHLRVPKAKEVLLSSPNPFGNQVPPHKGTPAPAPSHGKNSTMASLALSI